MKVRCSSCFQEYEDTFGLCPFCGYAPLDPPEEAFCLPPGTVIADRYIVGGMQGILSQRHREPTAGRNKSDPGGCT